MIRIIDPLRDSLIQFVTVFYVISGIGRRISDAIHNRIGGIGKTLAEKHKDKLGNIGNTFIGKGVKGAFRLGKGAVTLPFTALGAAGNSLRRHQIRSGQAYDMSAAERLSFMDENPSLINKLFHKGSGYGHREADTLMSGQSDEDISRIADLLGEVRQGASYMPKKIKQTRRKLYKDTEDYLCW